MERCASCERELASSWKFCLYCGRPFIPASGSAAAKVPNRTPSLPVEHDDGEPRPRKFDGTFWVGVAMGFVGLALIVYAATQIFAPGV